MRKRAALAATTASIAAIAAAGCGGSSNPASTRAANPNAPEVNPAGDIPDNQAFVVYTPPQGGFSVKVPEGWSKSATAGGAVTFTDKLNAISVRSSATGAPLTVGQARRVEVARLANSVRGFQLRAISPIARNAGTAVRISYLATARRDPVTGKSGIDAVERYVFFHRGHEVVLTLSGPKGADNVDPWRIVTDSLRWTP